MIFCVGGANTWAFRMLEPPRPLPWLSGITLPTRFGYDSGTIVLAQIATALLDREVYLSLGCEIPIGLPAKRRCVEGRNFDLQVVAQVRSSLDYKDGLTVIL